MKRADTYNSQEETELYRSMIGALPQSMFLLDKDKVVIGIFNAAPETLAGFSSDDIVGNSILKYANDTKSPFYQAYSMLNSTFDQVFESGEPLKLQYMILDSYMEATITKIPGERILCQVMDISDIVLRQQETDHRNNEELTMALMTGGVTSWTYNLAEGTVRSRQQNNIIDGITSFEELMGRIDPEHRDTVRRELDNIAAGSTKHVCVTAQVTTTTGEVQWMEVHAIPHEYDNQGHVTVIIGSQKNITPEREYNEKLEQLVRELEEAKEKAERSDRLKSAFLANMSHEIRTPLNAIVGFSQLIPDADDDDERRNYIDIIDKNKDILLTLINDILDLSKIEAGYQEYNNTIFDLSELFRDLEKMFWQKMPEGVELLVDRPHEEYSVNLDRTKVMQVVSNFGTNSVKFTKQGHIRIGYCETEGGVKVYVEDTGCGMSEEQTAQVFERFEKFSSCEQGTGLGTSIAKAIVAGYGGRIGVESVKGAGSTFWAIFPFQHP